MNSNIHADDLDNNLHPDDDNRYTWPIGSEEVVVQWALMAKDEIITQEEADRRAAADAEFAKAKLARRRPSLMSEANRLKFMHALTLNGWTQADLVTAVPPSKRGFAQRLSDCAAASAARPASQTTQTSEMNGAANN